MRGNVSVTVDDFRKIDLRIGKVIEASPVEGSQKLLKLIVDAGVEKRQIVAGIAEHYRPEELVGKYIVIVANLKPKKIMGIESQGMLLATCGKPVILTLDKPEEGYVGERVC